MVGFVAFTDWLHDVGCRIFLCSLRELPNLVNSCGAGSYGAVCVDDSNLEQSLLFSFIWEKREMECRAVVVTGPTMLSKRVTDTWYQHDGIHHLVKLVTYRLERVDELQFLRFAFISIALTQVEGDLEGDLEALLAKAVSEESYEKFKEAWPKEKEKKFWNKRERVTWLKKITKGKCSNERF